MRVFAVFNISNRGVVLERLREHYPDQHIDANRESFFVATTGETSQQVSEKLGFGADNVSAGIVLGVTTYWGRADPNLWEWISAKMEANGK